MAPTTRRARLDHQSQLIQNSPAIRIRLGSILPGQSIESVIPIDDLTPFELIHARIHSASQFFPSLQPSNRLDHQFRGIRASPSSSRRLDEALVVQGRRGVRAISTQNPLRSPQLIIVPCGIRRIHPAKVEFRPPPSQLTRVAALTTRALARLGARNPHTALRLIDQSRSF